MRKILMIAALTASALFATDAAHAATNFVQDGTFTNPPGGTYTTYSANQSFGPWTVTSGSVDLIGSYWVAPGGGSVDLDGESPGAISQLLNLSPGNYVLTFDLSGNPEGGDPVKALSVSVGNIVGSPFSYTTGANTKTNMNFVTKTLAFTATGPTSLTFASTDTGGPFGAAIANVVVSSVPEPATWAMLLMGFAMIGFVVRKRSHVRTTVSYA